MKSRWMLVFFATLIGFAAHGSEQLPAEVTINGVEFVRVPGGKVAYPIPHVNHRTGNPIGSGRREITVEVDGYYLGKYEARGRDTRPAGA